MRDKEEAEEIWVLLSYGSTCEYQVVKLNRENKTTVGALLL